MKATTTKQRVRAIWTYSTLVRCPTAMKAAAQNRGQELFGPHDSNGNEGRFLLSAMFDSYIPGDSDNEGR
ncbi:hypothetical protein MA16_Dca028571 [Dendrobium catenatum]|uniref:Uncharacterized protein n=1 Tax=Dendrobium catenatum TaxID=906689 RepID=A0A2I0V6I8_9ASPA|nr:hypothetical protein MA16_Dca028571 [Dendrobium catenatum]